MVVWSAAAGSRLARRPRPMRRGWLRRNRQEALWLSQRVFFWARRSRVAGAAAPAPYCLRCFAGSDKGRRLSARSGCISMVNPPSGGLGLGNAKIGGLARRTLSVVGRTVISVPPVSRLAGSYSETVSLSDRNCGSNRCPVCRLGVWPAGGRAREVRPWSYLRADTAPHPTADL
jgi:hypothetical protein